MKLKKIILCSSIGVLLDQVIKFLITFLPINIKFTIIPHFFYITHIHNDGADCNIFSGYRLFLISITLLILLIIFKYIEKNNLKKIEKISFILIISGIIGNLIDRIFRGYVIDYLEFHIINYNFPVFNIADSMIIIGFIIFLIKGDLNGKNSSK